jgi:UDP-N-acetyl-D-mannosaminuronic acid dehydrogenase
VRSYSHPGLVILIESTVPPLTTSRLVLPQLKELWLEIEQNVFVAYCPERLSPTHALEEFVQNPHVVGGIGPISTEVAAALMKTVCKEVLQTDALTAELAKVAENTFRDVNIAYANLLALITEHFGGDVSKVIELANTHPRVKILKPGAGVGGPCITKDPYLLTYNVPEELTELIRICRRLNDEMPNRLTNRVRRLLQEKAVSLSSAKVAVLGVAYKADTEDTSGTPARLIIEGLLRLGARVYVYDPFSSQTYGAVRALSLEESLRNADAVMVVTPHSSFKLIDLEVVRSLTKPHCIMFDGARIFDPSDAVRAGLVYSGTGYGVSNGYQVHRKEKS